MTTETYPHSLIYSDIENANKYWESLKPGTHPILPYADKWKLLVPFFEQISTRNCVVVLLWDVVTNRFIYATDQRNVVGYDMSLYLAEDGVNFSMGNVHPDHLDPGLMMNKRAMDYLVERKESELSKIVVNFDGKYKKSSGTYFHFLQQVICIETSEQNYPLLFLSYIHDITHLKKENAVNLVITAPDEIRLWNFNFDKNILEAAHPLSRQEKKILSCLAQGKSSKEIATELFISPNTVDTHRRNLLERTNCLNTTGLVTYAKLVGLL